MPKAASVVPAPSSSAVAARLSARIMSKASRGRSPSFAIIPTRPEPVRPRSWYEPSKLDIFFLGITIVMCGQYMSWNIGLVAGVYTYLIHYVIMGLAYLTFCCCMAEITSALPFAGGSYGLARCTLGYFPAFFIGCAEALEYTASVAIQAVCVCEIVTSASPNLLDYKPLVWLVVFFLPTTVVQCVGGAPFWFVSTALGVFQTVLLVIYCFGLLGDVSFSENVLKEPGVLFTGDKDIVMYVFPFSAWFFLGVEALNLASNDVVKPKTQIPSGQVACICVLLVTGLAMYLTTVSLPMDGGIPAVAGALAPLNNGFARLFHMDSAKATLLSLPAQFAGGYGFFWASAKLISSMGKSRLLPPWLGTESRRFRTPHWAIIATSIVAYGVCLLVHYQPDVIGYILPVCLLFAFLSYSGQCAGYIILTRHYPIHSERKFKNPFGTAGAVYSLCVWIVGIIAIVRFQGHHGIEVLIFAAAASILGVYYLLVARQRQTMSNEESRVLLAAHIAFFSPPKKRSRDTRRSAIHSSTGRSVRNHTVVRTTGILESFHASQAE